MRAFFVRLAIPVVPGIMPRMSAGRSISFGAVILAAGASSRMGRPKMLLPWGDTTLLGHLIRVWQSLGAGQLAVVCAASDAGIAAELDRLQFPPADRIPNPDPARGMFSSIQCAAGWSGWRPGLTHWAIVLGDQPHLQPATLQALLDFAAAHPQNICQPGHAGRARHPVILSAAAFNRLASSPAPTLKDFLQPLSAEIKLVELPDAGLDLDLDHPADYELAIRHRAAKPQP
jgi:molybdenum cofactor cytidylyltransferase